MIIFKNEKSAAKQSAIFLYCKENCTDGNMKNYKWGKIILIESDCQRVSDILTQTVYMFSLSVSYNTDAVLFFKVNEEGGGLHAFALTLCDLQADVCIWLRQLRHIRASSLHLAV